MRKIRLKSHQLGVTTPHTDVENNQNESIVQEKTEENRLIGSENNLPLNIQSCSTSLEDSLFQFANSRTHIKP